MSKDREATQPLTLGTDDPEALPIVAEETYRDRTELARGGLGRVMRAHHTTMRRVVALKELLPGIRGAEARFIREALVTGRLEHPSIVPVYEAGRWPTGEPFYAMKLVSGRPLGELVREVPTLAGRLSFLSNVIAVADALAYAHSRRIIHRDIKPGNVIVGQFGETVVIDWGLAKELDDDLPEPTITDASTRQSDEHTMLGEVLGTPAYMSPEQAMALPVDERTDVWALGALLYFVLAGEAPHGGSERPKETATRAILRGDSNEDTRAEAVAPESVMLGPSGNPLDLPIPLAARQPDVPRELHAIVEKAMATLPDERYPSAREFADDLKKFQTGQLVSAYQYTIWGLLERWLRRYRLLVGVIAAAVVVTLGAVAWSFVRIVAARGVAEARADELVLLQARSALDDDPTAAVAWLKQYPRRAPGWDEARRILAEARARGVARDVWRDHDASISSLAVSADGRWLASADGDGVVVLRGPDHERRTVTPLAKATGVMDLSFDGQRVARADESGGVFVDGQRLGGHDDRVGAIAFSPNGKLVASASTDRTIHLWGEGEPRVLRGHELEVTGVVFAPDGHALASTSEDRTVRIWPLAGGEPRVFDAGTPTTSAAFSADGSHLAVAGRGGVRIWDLRRPEAAPLASREQAGHEIYAVGFTPKGLVVLGGVDGVEITTASLVTVLRLPGHVGSVNALAVSPDGKTVYSGGADQTIRVWSIPTELGATLREGNQPDGTGARPRVSPDGRRIAAPGRDGTILVVTGSERLVLTGHDGPVKEIAFLPDGAQLVSLGQDQTLRRWDLASGTGTILHRTASQPFRLRVAGDGSRIAFTEGFEDLSVVALDGRVVCVFPSRGNTGSELAPDGTHVAFAQAGELRWGELAGCSARTLYRHDDSVFGIAFTRDGRWLASASGDGRIGLAALDGTTPVRFLEGHKRGVYSVAFSPDGRRLASGDFDGEGRIWDVEAGQGVTVLHGHEKALLYLGWTPDGDRVVTSGGDETVRLWDPATGETVAREADTGVGGFAVFPDGRQVVSASPKAVRVWPVDTRPLPPQPEDGLRRWMDDVTSARIDGDRLASP
jgi:eukaryotic-like serine/threonine-protein kinase